MPVRTEDDGIPIGVDETATLQMLANGELNEKFPDALKLAVANILSGDYPPDKKRQIIITVNLTPDKKRTAADLEVEIQTKFPKKIPGKSRLYFNAAANEVVISEFNAEQRKLAFQ